MNCIDTTNTTIAWIECHHLLFAAIGTPVAAFVALGAAIIAYRGAIHQAKAAAKLDRERRKEQTRTFAAALWAELRSCRVRFVNTKDALRTTGLIHPSKLPRAELETEIYMAAPNRVGDLGTRVSLATILAYKVIRREAQTARERRSSVSEGMSDYYAIDLEKAFGRIIKVIDTALLEIEAVVEIPADLRAGPVPAQA